MGTTKGEVTYLYGLHLLAMNVARLRRDRDLTFEGLGSAAGLHWRHVQKIEAGTGNVTLRTLARLADGLRVEMVDLLRRG